MVPRGRALPVAKPGVLEEGVCGESWENFIGRGRVFWHRFAVFHIVLCGPMSFPCGFVSFL